MQTDDLFTYNNNQYDWMQRCCNCSPFFFTREVVDRPFVDCNSHIVVCSSYYDIDDRSEDVDKVDLTCFVSSLGTTYNDSGFFHSFSSSKCWCGQYFFGFCFWCCFSRFAFLINSRWSGVLRVLPSQRHSETRKTLFSRVCLHRIS